MASTRSVTDDESDDRPTDVVEVAVRFVASQIGGPARVLAIHHLRDRGLCGGCTVRPTRWPCSAAVIAMSASQQGSADPARTGPTRVATTPGTAGTSRSA